MSKPIPRWDVHFGGLEDCRKDYTSPHITSGPQLGGHRHCGLAICTFHLGFSLVPRQSDAGSISRAVEEIFTYRGGGEVDARPPGTSTIGYIIVNQPLHCLLPSLKLFGSHPAAGEQPFCNRKKRTKPPNMYGTWCPGQRQADVTRLQQDIP